MFGQSRGLDNLDIGPCGSTNRGHLQPISPSWNRNSVSWQLRLPRIGIGHRIGPMATRSQGMKRIVLSYLWSILIWLGFSLVMAGGDKVRLAERGLYTAYWSLLLVNGAWCLTAALLTPPLFSVVRRYPIARQAGLGRVASYLLGSVPYVLASVCVRSILLPPWNSATQQFAPRSLQGLIQNTYLFANQIWDYFVIVVAAHAYEYFERARNEELQRSELQQALAASELQVLKSQLHPHFLFNTLNGISILIDSNPARARAMVLKLSGLLRTALEYGNSDLISCAEELRFVVGYLDLEKMRLEDRLRVRWEIDPQTREMLVPQLILQPLVENAIVHGIACCREGGWIEVASRQRKNMLELEIKNSVGGRSQGGMGLGLQNTKARLRHLYGDEGTFSFRIAHEGVAIATLAFPGFAPRQTQSDGAALPAAEMGRSYARTDH